MKNQTIKEYLNNLWLKYDKALLNEDEGTIIDIACELNNFAEHVNVDKVTFMAFMSTFEKLTHVENMFEVSLKENKLNWIDIY